MPLALLIYEAPGHCASRNTDGDDVPYIGAWRAYYQSRVDAGV